MPAPPPPSSLFSTSWTLHRMSPLYHARTCPDTSLLDSPAGLKLYASRLRDTLTGDLLGGVQLSTSSGGVAPASAVDEALANAGALRSCAWTLLPTWQHWNEEQSLLEGDDEDDEDGPVLMPDQCAGIMVTLVYQHATYRAALLAGPDGYGHYPHGGGRSSSTVASPATRAEEHGVTYLPLLVTRMPNALRQELIAFLSAQFDTRISVLRLPSDFLVGALEGYLRTLNRISSSSSTSTAARRLIERVMRETQLTLSFPPPISPSLKTLDVLVPRESLSAMHEYGSTAASTTTTTTATPTTSQQQQQQQQLRKTQKDGPDTDTPSAPFLSALSSFFSTHLAMPLDAPLALALAPTSSSSSTTTTTTTTASAASAAPAPPHADPPAPVPARARARAPTYVRLTKISCGAFVLGAEGRVKFLADPGRAMFLAHADDESESGTGGADGDEDEEDMLEREKRLIWRANEGLLRALVRRALGTG
ncbi:hypothetical protein VTO42DRAFT_7232 [Malbranchea cinnamomea]